MKRISHVAMLLAVACLVAADQGKKKNGDAEKIQGEWIISEYYRNGIKVNDIDVVGGTFTFSGKGKTVTFAPPAPPAPEARQPAVVYSIKLRADKNPRELDVILKDDTVQKPIYELAGDTLQICTVNAGNPRPAAIGSSKDDERRLIVLKRVKGGDKGDGKK